MKKLGVILLSLSLFAGMYPQKAMASQITNFEQDLTQYLATISTERGFEVTKEDLEASLATYELSFDDFDSVKELSSGFGEVIKTDLSNLTKLYETYNLDETTLQQLLTDNGDALADYIYLNDLDLSLFFYSDNNDVFERDPNFDQNFTNYLAKVSGERGFEVTKEAVEASLTSYDTTLEEFQTVEELSDFLGEVINSDLSNLSIYYDTNGLDEQSLLQLLEDNGKDINDYIYVYDLGDIVWSSESEYPVIDEAMFTDLLDEIDLTEDELQNIENYFISLQDYLADPAVLDRFTALAERMSVMDDVIRSEELTKEQVDEVLSIFEEAFSIFKLDVSLSLIKDGSETKLSMMDLYNLKELENADLKVSLYGDNSLFLADIIITSDFINSGGLVGEAEDVIEAVDLSVVTKPDKQVSTKAKTVKGGKLPETASNYIPNALIGFIIAFVGILMYRKVRNVKGGLVQK
jgi:processed acidic surface protein